MQRLQKGAGNRELSAFVAAGATTPGVRTVARDAEPTTSTLEPNPLPASGPTDPATAAPLTSEPAAGSSELVSGTEVMPPDVAQRVIAARVTLGRIPVMSPADQALLGLAIPGAQVVDLIARREMLRANMTAQQIEIDARIPAARLPDDQQAKLEDEIAPFILEVSRLREQLEEVQTLIDAITTGLGLAHEADLLKVVQDDFPKLFVERAKLIAYRQLDDNMEIVSAEAARYGLGIPGQGAGANASPAEFATKPEDLARVRAAAAHVIALDNQMELVHKTAKEERKRTNDESWRNATVTHPEDDDEDVEPSVTPAPVDDSTAEETEQLTVPLQQERDALCLEFPILFRTEMLTTLSTSSDDDIARATGALAGKVMDDITSTKKSIASDDLKVWNLRGIMDLTAQDMGIREDSTLMRVVERKGAETEADEALLKIARSALAIVGAIVATVASGGVALVGAAVAFGAGGYELATDVKKYEVESAAGDVALDPAIADISYNDPEILPIILDLVGMAMSAADLGAAINGLRAPAKALAAGGDIAVFATAARKFVAADRAEAFILRAGRMAGSDAHVLNAVNQVGDAFRHADLAEVAKLMESSAEVGFRQVFENLSKVGNVRPYNAENVAYYFGKLGAKQFEDPLVRAVYDPLNKMLFVREGLSQGEFGSWAVHELSHHLQDLYGAELTSFEAEYQAFKMQQSYLLGLERAAASEAIPEHMRWLLNATDEDVAAHITQMYGYVSPKDFEREEMLEKMLTWLGRASG